ncbi:carbamoyltransferase C-terminal domain-containing protein [Methylomicrobium sp. Wu6]|uniref:carbamoyltransferase family protein n=1 Tax=Methylomicrobium sp. Wu6 TaxID=3107928 RepID=UPI002DD63138|nr:carbamoyltransferase C-terminal domain-containing protein [Methylomicrobium sp. Wu6]MEC4749193.1 carbamoyltransferase C-terminal domain-containing protein [Methylomicrobium sp. Wu6]
MNHYTIGLSVTYHDSALAILDAEGSVLFAEATERYLQNKRALNAEPDQLFRIPELLETYCPEPGALTIASNWRKKRPLYEAILSRLGWLTAPGLLKDGIKRLRSPLSNYQLHHMMACQHNSIRNAGLNLVRVLRERYPHCHITFADYDHHLTHAAAASYGSLFEDAACAVIDSFGEHGAMAFYRYRNGGLERLYEARGAGTASLGLYYMKITELCGFDWLKGEEWKVMGLAPYGRLNEELYALLQSTITLDGFAARHGGKDLFARIDRLDAFKHERLDPIEQAADLACTGQVFFAEIVNRLLRHLHQVTQSDNLTLAGGCALNSSNNGRITRETPFKQVYIPSAPADDGCALGAAWLAHYAAHPATSTPKAIQTPYTGSFIADEAIERLLRFNRTLSIEHLPDTICDATAKRLAAGQLVGWLQGRAEFGPRALGNRSILADPRFAEAQALINEKIKFRETFRPFAPSILHEFGPEYFENYQESPYMDKTLKIREAMRQPIAAVCHVDGTGRLQTVKKDWNPRFYQLIDCFRLLTGVPVLLNTSFNVMGKPLAHSLEDAIALFLTTGLDVLVINDYLISKTRDE